jgi:hypothetical protein
MDDFFASLYEFFGLNPFYSRDMGDLLRGWDITCTDYIGTPWYVIIGWSMVSSALFIYATQYLFIDSSRWNKKQHWWLFALLIFLLNFFGAFIKSYNILRADDYCNQLNLSASDCVGFGLANAIWSFILFLIITSVPVVRRFSINCRHTTFWKP